MLARAIKKITPKSREGKSFILELNSFYTINALVCSSHNEYDETGIDVVEAINFGNIFNSLN